jgi:hypothetical protein
MNGFIILHKKFYYWEWYTDSHVMRLFIHFLLKANYTDKMWRGKLIKRGQFITSITKLGSELELSAQQIRTAFDKLISSNDILKTTTSQYTLITVVKYDYYQKTENFFNKQNNKQTNNQITNHQQSNNKQITTTKEYKEKKRSNNERERVAHIFLKNNDLFFWDNYLNEYKEKVTEFELMLKNFDLKMQEENFPFETTKLKARLERWTINWIKNQYNNKIKKFIPHR